MKHILQRVALLFAVGGFVGDVIAMAVGPRAIAWFNTPVLGQALCECEAVTRQTASTIIQVQLIATLSGGVLGVVVGLVVSSVWRRRAHAAGLDLVRPTAAVSAGPGGSDG